MKQLTDSERLKVMMGLLTTQQHERYRLNCETLKQDEEQARNIADIVIIQRPTECGDFECSHCPLYYDEMGKKQIGCPYVD